MGEMTKIIKKHSGGTCYQSERFTLDHFVPPEYQDKDEVSPCFHIFFGEGIDINMISLDQNKIKNFKVITTSKSTC